MYPTLARLPAVTAEQVAHNSCFSNPAVLSSELGPRSRRTSLRQLLPLIAYFSKNAMYAVDSCVRVTPVGGRAVVSAEYRCEARERQVPAGCRRCGPCL